jgi:phytoene/squalene synthetase
MYGTACRRYGVSQDSLGSYIGQVLLRAGDEVEDVEISEAEIAALREQISRREAEIFAGQRDVQQKADHTYALRKEIDGLHFEC